MPPALERIKTVAKDGKLHSVWRKLKDEAAKLSKDKDDKKEVAKLFKTFDSGLSAILTKFEKTESLEKAQQYAEQAVAITKDYRKKVADAKGGPKFLPLSSGLDALTKYFEDFLKEIKAVT
jgi:hypothetical protein